MLCATQGIYLDHRIGAVKAQNADLAAAVGKTQLVTGNGVGDGGLAINTDSRGGIVHQHGEPAKPSLPLAQQALSRRLAKTRAARCQQQQRHGYGG